MDLSGKNIVYVGGTGGIGQATCKKLIEKNVHHLVVLDKCNVDDPLEAFRNINPKVKLHFWYFDVTMNIQDMKRIFKEIISKIENIDVLINGAGILNENNIEATVKVNLLGVINTTVAAMDFLGKHNGGKGGSVIVNIASIAGLNGYSFCAVYNATKAGIISFSQATAQLESTTGIKVFVVCPGVTRTSLIDGDPATFLGLDEALAKEVRATYHAQTSDEFARNFIDCLEMCKNGAIWIVKDNQKAAVEWPDFINQSKYLE